MPDRPFAPTAAKRERARQEGHAPRGRDLTPVAVVIAALLVIVFGGSRMAEQLLATMQSGMATGTAESAAVSPVTTGPLLSVSADQVVRIGRSAFFRVANIVLPMIVAVMFAAIGSQWGQVGFRWLTDRVQPDLKRVDPLAGAGRLFQLSRWMDGVLILVRFATGILVVGCSLWFSRDRLAIFGDPVRSLSELPSAVAWVLLTASAALAVIAVAEYGVRCWLFEKQLWMTAEEMQNESKGQSSDLRVQSLTTDARQQMKKQRPLADWNEEGID